MTEHNTSNDRATLELLVARGDALVEREGCASFAPGDWCIIKSALQRTHETTARRDWRGLLDLPRVRIIGSAGLKDPKSDYAFLTIEIWTQHSAATTPEAREALEQFFEKAARQAQEKSGG